MADSGIEIAGSRILVVDDTPANLEVLCLALEAAGYEVMFAGSGPVALELTKRFGPDLLLLDVTMPGMDGYEVCRRLQEDEAMRSIPVIFLTARGDVDNVVEGLQTGGVDYVIKPFRKEEVLARVRTQLERSRLLREVVEKSAELQAQADELAEKNRALVAEVEERRRLMDERDELAGRVAHLSQLQAESAGVSGFIGRSQAVQAVHEEIALLQQAHPVSVLVSGESGTGKEVIARAIHFGGSRVRGPFVAVNCAAIPADLAESSFFGHMRGAFTGARDNHRGYFEQADGGTLFLDEIGDLPLELQSKLLRTLETGTVTPVGATREVTVDVRIVAASNRNLPALIAQDRFREDLYFRLAGMSVTLPPLRDRREDIPLLVDHFLRHFAEEMGHEPAGVSKEALEALEAHDFPGNVRELRNLMGFALIRSGGGLIRPKHLRFTELRRADGPPRSTPAAGAPTVTALPRPAAEVDSPGPEEQIQAFVRQHGSISNTECRQLLSVDLQRASYLLKKLHAEGVLAKHGQRRWTRYSLASRSD